MSLTHGCTVRTSLKFLIASLLHNNPWRKESIVYGTSARKSICTAGTCELLAVVADCSNVMFSALWEWEEVSVCCQHGVMDGRAMGVGGGIHPISDSCNG